MTIPFRRPSRAGVRPSPVFLGILAVTAASGGYAWQATTVTRGVQFGVFVFVVAAWIVTLCLHEFAHAFLAWRFGDREVEARGYLTLNPLKYSHPVLSILLPVVFIAISGFGLPGGAVYIHPHQFRTRAQRAIVSLSGPAVNAVFAVVLLVLVAQVGQHSHTIFWLGVSFLASLQIMALLLNLIPLPGLDGYGAIEPYLDPRFQRSAEQFKPFGMLAVFVLLQTPTLNRVFFNAVYWLFELSGISSAVPQFAYGLIKFWQK
jgi:Zn-dependent protease